MLVPLDFDECYDLETDCYYFSQRVDRLVR
jgi:hypothetical protein